MSHIKASFELNQPAIRPLRTIELVEIEEQRVISSVSSEIKEKSPTQVKSDGKSCLLNLLKARSKASGPAALRPRVGGAQGNESDTEDA
eukprot:324320-Hanusia_phi.AAC.3